MEESHSSGHDKLIEDVAFIRATLVGYGKAQDEFLAVIKEHKEKDDERFDKIGERLNGVEAQLWKAKGMAAVIGAVFAIGVGFLRDILFHK